jgi:hypothetical protein
MEENLRDRKAFNTNSHCLIEMTSSYPAFLSNHLFGTILSHFLSEKLLLKSHESEGVPWVTFFYCFVIREHELFHYWVDSLLAYLKLSLEVLCHIAKLLFHVIDQMRLSLQVDFLV